MDSSQSDQTIRKLTTAAPVLLRRLTRAWFRFSDAMAWFLFVLAALSAVGVFLIDVVPPVRFTLGQRLHAAIPCLIIAIGAFLLARRRPVGLPMVMLVPLVPSVDSHFSLVYVALALIVFGSPFVTAFLSAYIRAVARARQCAT